MEFEALVTKVVRSELKSICHKLLELIDSPSSKPEASLEALRLALEGPLPPKRAKRLKPKEEPTAFSNKQHAWKDKIFKGTVAAEVCAALSGSRMTMAELCNKLKHANVVTLKGKVWYLKRQGFIEADSDGKLILVRMPEVLDRAPPVVRRKNTGNPVNTLLAP